MYQAVQVIGGRPGLPLLDAFRRREPEAVRAVVQSYGHLVFAVARRVLGRDDLAEEATQQTFVRAWQAADRLDVDRDPAPWLATIAKHTAIDIHRRESRRAAVSFAVVGANDPVLMLPAPEMETLDAVWRVRRAIDALPPELAVIVRLQHLDGLSHTEIAESLHLAIGTVKSRSHRAHRRLARLLGRLRPTGDQSTAATRVSAANEQ